jgi:hypothetical protein
LPGGEEEEEEEEAIVAEEDICLESLNIILIIASPRRSYSRQ